MHLTAAAAVVYWVRAIASSNAVVACVQHCTATCRLNTASITSCLHATYRETYRSSLSREQKQPIHTRGEVSRKFQPRPGTFVFDVFRDQRVQNAQLRLQQRRVLLHYLEKTACRDRASGRAIRKKRLTVDYLI